MNSNYEWQKFMVKERGQRRLMEAETHFLAKYKANRAGNDRRPLRVTSFTKVVALGVVLFLAIWPLLTG